MAFSIYAFRLPRGLHRFIKHFIIATYKLVDSAYFYVASAVAM
jgi:hypothetical protein